ncbi:MAG: hypothetical protein JXR96_02040 [Deltaproteobacteria bacterium]|nr:hypothetical protein [Deltaproteobacteria bacterium]
MRRALQSAGFARALGIGAALLALGCAGCALAAPAYRPARVPHGELALGGGVWVLRLDGTPAQRGEAAGKLVGEQIRHILPRYLRAATGAKRLEEKQREAIEALAAGLPAAHAAQLRAMARSAGVPYEQLLVANLATEASAGLHCSCALVRGRASSDGKVRLARNLDWYAGDVLGGSGLVVIESTRDGARAFASLTWPGLVGVVTGMNDAGLAAADLMVMRGEIRPGGLPVLFAVRSMLERCGSVSEALDFLRAARRSMPQNYALADPSGGAVVETGVERFRVRPGSGDLAVITNFYDEDRKGRSDGRYARMIAAIEGPQDADGLERVLARVALGEMNVQAAVLVPADRVVHLSTGKPPAARGPWVRLDLEAWLRSTPPSPSP